MEPSSKPRTIEIDPKKHHTKSLSNIGKGDKFFIINRKKLVFQMRIMSQGSKVKIEGPKKMLIKAQADNQAFDIEVYFGPEHGRKLSFEVLEGENLAILTHVM